MMTMERQKRLLDSALVLVGCKLEHATICYVLLNEQLGDERRWVKLSSEQIARRPDRLCCTVRDAEHFMRQVIAMGFVRKAGEAIRDVAYQLDWERITAIIGKPGTVPPPAA